MKPLPLSRVRAGYDRLRTRYFIDAERPLRIPPTAAGLRWSWLPANSDAIAETIFDEDGDPEELRLNPKYADRWTLVRPTLLHELTHMRLGQVPSCGAFSHPAKGVPRIARSSAWHRETLRLAALGALQL